MLRSKLFESAVYCLFNINSESIKTNICSYYGYVDVFTALRLVLHFISVAGNFYAVSVSAGVVISRRVTVQHSRFRDEGTLITSVVNANSSDLSRITWYPKKNVCSYTHLVPNMFVIQTFPLNSLISYHNFTSYLDYAD